MLSSGEDKRYEKVERAFSAASKEVHSTGGFTAKDMSSPHARRLTEATYEVLRQAIEPHLRREMPQAMQQRLRSDTFVFSGMKTYTSLREVSSLLLDDQGNVKPWSTFRDEVTSINKAYNRQYLEAEYIFATQSSQSAAHWASFSKDGARYDLQYRTAADDKVRASHQTLHNTTLPSEDPFWDFYFPPNGWRCRCRVVQVRKGKSQHSNSTEAQKAGEMATTQIGPSGDNKAAMFRFNPGKKQVIFPPTHPYGCSKSAGCSRLSQLSDGDGIPDKCKGCLIVREMEKQKRLNVETRQREYKVLKADKNYTDVAFDPKTGGLQATHRLHIFDPNRGHYEKECRDILFSKGHKVILGQELFKKAKDGVKHADGRLDDLRFEIRTSLGDGKNNIKGALDHARKKGANIAVVYLPNESTFPKERISQGIAMYEGKHTHRFQTMYFVLGDGSVIAYR